jgi:RNA polymerase-binding transcription factor DksA
MPTSKKKSAPKRPSKTKAVKKAPAPKKAAKAPARKPQSAKNHAPSKKASASRADTPAKRDTSESAAILGNNHVRNKSEKRLDPFVREQKQRLLQLRDAMVDSMAGVAQDTLRSRAEGSEASAFGMHQADAGSDAYDRDFALSLLSQEQDALYEIDEALKRIELGTYGICEMSGKPIPHARLEAIPFARFTVECQSQLEKQSKASRVRQSVTSLFGLTEDEGGDGEEEEAPTPKNED